MFLHVSDTNISSWEATRSCELKAMSTTCHCLSAMRNRRCHARNDSLIVFACHNCHNHGFFSPTTERNLTHHGSARSSQVNHHLFREPREEPQTLTKMKDSGHQLTCRVSHSNAGACRPDGSIDRARFFSQDQRRKDKAFPAGIVLSSVERCLIWWLYT